MHTVIVRSVYPQDKFESFNLEGENGSPALVLVVSSASVTEEALGTQRDGAVLIKLAGSPPLES